MFAAIDVRLVVLTGLLSLSLFIVHCSLFVVVVIVVVVVSVVLSPSECACMGIRDLLPQRHGIFQQMDSVVKQ